MPKGEYLQYGGQAIIEGVMMRSPRFFAVACRAPNGEIVLQTEAIEKTWIGRQKWLRYPFLRGSLALLDAMALGMRAMKFASNVQLSAEHQPVDENATGETQGHEVVTKSNKKIQEGAVALTMVFSLAFGFFLFVYLPNIIAEYSSRWFHQTNSTITNVVAEVVKMLLFFGYIYGIGRLPDVHEVFKYHGAEHKAINTLEHEKPLHLDECLKETRLHPRCGTSFAILVLLVGLVVFTFVPRYPISGHPGNPLSDVTVRVLIELAILPIVAGVSYELLRLAGRFRNQAFVNAAFKPGIWTQYLTTAEPEAKHIEVALVALRAVLEAEDKLDGKSDLDEELESAPDILVNPLIG